MREAVIDKGQLFPSFAFRVHHPLDECVRRFEKVENRRRLPALRRSERFNVTRTTPKTVQFEIRVFRRAGIGTIAGDAREEDGVTQVSGSIKMDIERKTIIVVSFALFALSVYIARSSMQMALILAGIGSILLLSSAVSAAILRQHIVSLMRQIFE
jgi:hypothetical protein